MKLEIKNPHIIVGALPPFAALRLELHISARTVRFSLPYSAMDLLTVLGVRYLEVDSILLFQGDINGLPVTIRIAGRKVLAAKHGLRGVLFDVELGNLEISWSHENATDGGSKQSNVSEGMEHGIDRVADVVETVDAGVAHE